MAAASRRLPRLYLGSMTFGWEKASTPVTEVIAAEMVLRAAAAGVRHLDSARIYAGGATEPIVGTVLRNIGTSAPEVRASLVVTTKAHPSQPQGLSAAGLAAQLQTSLSAMGLDSVDELYLHQPDTEHELAESLAAAHDLVAKGLVRRLGMSNYHDIEVERALQLCKDNNWTSPSIYQGIYNPLNRRVEATLLPLLKRNNIDFIAYNALAAGLLTGKHRGGEGEEVVTGRFKDNPNYLPRFYTDANFKAVELIKASLPEGVDLISATYQWLLRHSMLAWQNDGLLLGASSMEQLEINLAACSAAESADDLPASTLKAFDDAWEVCKDTSFPYWRGYSKDQPGRDGLDPGAAYDAHHAKK
jgi:aflatoxin B1 aldehyde reductase